jgi:hypothetical protein
MTDMPALEDCKEARSAGDRICQCILGNIEGKKAGTFCPLGRLLLHPLKT